MVFRACTPDEEATAMELNRELEIILQKAARENPSGQQAFYYWLRSRRVESPAPNYETMGAAIGHMEALYQEFLAGLTPEALTNE